MFLRTYSERLGVTILFVVSLSGCFVSSPYHGQVFANRTAPIPFQVWSDNPGYMYVECHKALQGELYQQNGDASWLRIQNPGFLDTTTPSFDSKGNRAQSMPGNIVLLDECWHRSGSATGPRYQSAVRLIQTVGYSSANGPRNRISYVFDKPGLGCALRAIGLSGLWSGFLGAGCYVTYDDSSVPLPYLIVESQS